MNRHFESFFERGKSGDAQAVKCFIGISMENNKPNISKLAWAIILSFGSIIGIFISFTALQTFIDSRINTFVNNHEFIRKVAKNVRPMLVFDSNGAILIDNGALEYIDKIEVVPNPGQLPSKIILHPKQFLSTIPILTSFSDRLIESIESKRSDNISISYLLKYRIHYGLKGGPIMKYRLEILP